MKCAKCNERPRLPKYSYCRECRNEIGRAWRRKNPGRKTPINKEAAKSWAAARRARNRAFVNEYKKGKPCMDCGGVFHPAAMQFDHNGSDKVFCVGRAAATTRGLAAIKEEIAKCDLVCANCHAVRTWA